VPRPEHPSESSCHPARPSCTAAPRAATDHAEASDEVTDAESDLETSWTGVLAQGIVCKRIRPQQVPKYLTPSISSASGLDVHLTFAALLSELDI
jgi:hypothetical protein